MVNVSDNDRSNTGASKRIPATDKTITKAFGKEKRIA